VFLNSCRRGVGVLGVFGFSLLGACSAPATTPPLTTVKEDPTDVPLHVASAELVARFQEGDLMFDRVFTEAEGLGPVFIRSACSSCHKSAAKGPGSVQKMALVLADGVTPAVDQGALTFGHTVRPYTAGGATTPLEPPPGNAEVKLSLRVGVAVFGRGYLEAVDGAEIERVEAEQAQRGDEITGRINRVVYTSEPNPDQRYHQYTKGQTGLIGRFGLKARIASLDEFAADASQGDMSITSPLRPDELGNPDGKTDDFKTGVDVDVSFINGLADYMRLLEIPRRATPSANGPALFASTGCATCHVPSMKTRADYPIAALAGIDAPIFTDLLLHDMGDQLADGLTDGMASSREWKTATLIGLRHFRSFLHDGRAATIGDAILQHDGTGSEAHGVIGKFQALSDSDRTELINYVSSL
jgi:CxxC motif-containing protein (DUF1111 family)